MIFNTPVIVLGRLDSRLKKNKEIVKIVPSSCMLVINLKSGSDNPLPFVFSRSRIRTN